MENIKGISNRNTSHTLKLMKASANNLDLGICNGLDMKMAEEDNKYQILDGKEIPTEKNSLGIAQ